MYAQQIIVNLIWERKVYNSGDYAYIGVNCGDIGFFLIYRKVYTKCQTVHRYIFNNSMYVQ